MSGDRLAGKVAIVTGASRGIGRAIALRFGAEGARIVANYERKSAEAAEVVDEIRSAGGEAVAIAADVSQKADVDRLVAQAMDAFGRIDILSNNAGIMVAKGVLETSEEE
ncbi:MAG TPA: SDR family NAD(P)-dependent oxidoreductase, partial [Candidatus Limnocylindria bacterium]|nr:SDR family NAD(P)-dependent oxidoreductase [Candidatus Limnocylindria bacterium]